MAETTNEKKIPEEFVRVLRDFLGDIRVTFPEYNSIISKWWKVPEDYAYIEEESDRQKSFEKAESKSVEKLFAFCQKKLPPRFFDILYQNEDMFKDDSEVDTEFFPQIHFKNLWQCPDLTEKTRVTIWKYLQLLSFTIVGTLTDKGMFGDSAMLFEAVDNDEFKGKLEETLKGIQEIFDMSGNFPFPDGMMDETPAEGDASSGSGTFPNMEELHGHINGMLGGKIGSMATEWAAEAAATLGLNLEDPEEMKTLFQKLIRDPSKMMQMVQKLGEKMNEKVRSGEIKESEIISEASEMLQKMKSMPGMGNIQSMLSKMGMGGMAGGGGGGKVNMNAMGAALDQRMKAAKTRERIRAKAQANMEMRAQAAAQASDAVPASTQAQTDEELMKLFQSAEKIERTPRGAKPAASIPQESTGGKKKKSKKPK